MDSFSDYLFVYVTLLSVGLLVFQVIRARDLKKACAPPKHNTFIFRGDPWQIAWSIGFPIIFISLQWSRWTFVFLIPLAFLIAIITLSVLYNKKVVILGQDRISTNDRSIKVKTEDITGIRISKHEVSLHTKKYINHHRLMTGDLVDKEWPEFQEAIAQYASQFDHIKVETV